MDRLESNLGEVEMRHEAIADMNESFDGMDDSSKGLSALLHYRREQNLASIGQVGLLLRMGVTQEQALKMTADEANQYFEDNYDK